MRAKQFEPMTPERQGGRVRVPAACFSDRNRDPEAITCPGVGAVGLGQSPSQGPDFGSRRKKARLGAPDGARPGQSGCPSRVFGGNGSRCNAPGQLRRRPAGRPGPGTGPLPPADCRDRPRSVRLNPHADDRPARPLHPRPRGVPRRPGAGPQRQLLRADARGRRVASDFRAPRSRSS